MKISKASPMQIRQLGIKALTEALDPGNSDYTKDRDELLKNATLEEILAQIDKQRQQSKK